MEELNANIEIVELISKYEGVGYHRSFSFLLALIKTKMLTELFAVDYFGQSRDFSRSLKFLLIFFQKNIPSHNFL